ncbi:MAG: ABC transporter ATP-binding protein [Clostridiales bacterium]|nr:ABC transporter ATP-binding protein [Clostridiales bacterium]
MAAIEALYLRKHFRAKVKGEGFSASLRSLVRPEYRETVAVRDISLTVSEGEIVAFIGPNGAGKSTTIKMMTGILHPTAGSIRVLGYDPVSQRQALSYHIGTVFGQKSQLWFHLPPLDSFRLLASIYEVDRLVYRQRLDDLVERFQIGGLLRTPVRKLSLGERVRCEIAASLLHWPRILFLDEPTIGLDVVVKHRIRELIGELSREDGVTVFLTSHDAGDIEQVCRRAIVIDHGRLVLDLPVKKLKYDYLNRKLVSVRFFEPQSLPAFPGVTAIKETGIAARLSVDTRAQPIGAVISALTGGGNVADITVADPPMEDIIADIFASRKEERS